MLENDLPRKKKNNEIKNKKKKQQTKKIQELNEEKVG